MAKTEEKNRLAIVDLYNAEGTEYHLLEAMTIGISPEDRIQHLKLALSECAMLQVELVTLIKQLSSL